MALQGDVARIFPWGGPKYLFQNFGKCNLGEYPLPLVDESSGGRGEVDRYVLPNKVVILERCRLLSNSVCRVVFQLVFYCGMSG